MLNVAQNRSFQEDPQAFIRDDFITANFYNTDNLVMDAD